MTKKIPEKDLHIKERQMKDLILLATLDQVAFDGWTTRALKNGVAEAGLSSNHLLKSFPGGVTDLIAHFADWSDRQMLLQAKEKDFAALGVRKCLAACIKARLTICAPHREAVHRLTSFLALPQNNALAARLTWETCSKIWYEAGDESTDWNYYSKRGLLAAAYSATILYWISDEAGEQGDFPATWRFLDRRLNGVVQTFGTVKKIEKSFSGLFKSFQKVCVNAGDKRC